MDFTQEDTEKLQEGIRKNRRYQFLLLVAVSAGIVGLSIYFISKSYNESRASVETQSMERLGGIVNTLAPALDGDAYERLMNRYTSLDAITSNDQDLAYKKLQQQLQSAQRNNGLESAIYTVTLNRDAAGAGEVAEFGIFSTDPSFRHPYDDPSGQIRQHYEQGALIPAYQSSTDTWVSAFAPIRNSKGEVVGVVEADIRLTQVIAETNSRFRASLVGIIAFTVGILVLIVVLTIFITRNILRAQTAILEAFNRINRTFNLLSDFASQIGKGNFEHDLTDIEEQENNLSESLLTMRSNLLDAKEEEEKRNWAIRGIAQFGEELRTNNHDLQLLSRNIVAGLVKYLNANQGAMYILDGDEYDPHLNLVATYAYSRQKYINGRVSLGEGLVGQCWQERERIYMTDVPQDYVKITSGLGDANPTSILIVPLVVNEELYGVIELASFNTLEAHELDFVERVAESIASTISVVKVNAQTAHLLEESQMLTEEMQAKEEELRQNAEEMRATQEEMDRKIKELEDRLELAGAPVM